MDSIERKSAGDERSQIMSRRAAEDGMSGRTEEALMTAEGLVSQYF